jgi:hypothetical protein
MIGIEEGHKIPGSAHIYLREFRLSAKVEGGVEGAPKGVDEKRGLTASLTTISLLPCPVIERI